jgi:hypothetical protein
MENDVRDALDRIERDQRTLAAAFSALRLLLETQFANRFADDPAQFDQVMAKLIWLTQTAATSSEPATAEEMIETAAEVAAHLQRFSRSTAERIAQRRPT